jgi:hypothetical protein
MPAGRGKIRKVVQQAVLHTYGQTWDYKDYKFDFESIRLDGHVTIL